jgi:acylglycerol lipase
MLSSGNRTDGQSQRDEGRAMIELHPSESVQADSPTVCQPAGPLPRSNQFVASRARLTATDGIALHYRAWLPASVPVSGALVFVHGIASHSAWFAQTAGFLAGGGIAVYAPDRRGSGLSGGPRGHAGSVEQLLSDLDRIISLTADEHPATPIFLAGSSWAAKLALAYAANAQDRLAGLLLHGPGLFPKVDLSVSQKLAVLARHRFQPTCQLPIPLTPESYTSQASYLAYIEGDPYRLLTASARFFWETRRLDRARTRLAARLTLPVLLQIGDADPIMDAEATCGWLQALPAPDRTAITYRNASHTLDFEAEPTVRAYRTDLFDWLRRQIDHHAESALKDEWAWETSNGR